MSEQAPKGQAEPSDADHAEWLADKIAACGDYAQEAAQMLRRWPKGQAELTDEIVAGILFDFGGFLTTHETRWRFSAYDDASPMVEAIRQFAERRSIARASLDEAKVEWRDALASQQSEQPAPAGQAEALWERIKILGLSNDRLALQSIRAALATPQAPAPVARLTNALQAIKYRCTSLADAQVLALEALKATPAATPQAPAGQELRRVLKDARDRFDTIPFADALDRNIVKRLDSALASMQAEAAPAGQKEALESVRKLATSIFVGCAQDPANVIGFYHEAVCAALAASQAEQKARSVGAEGEA